MGYLGSYKFQAESDAEVYLTILRDKSGSNVDSKASVDEARSLLYLLVCGSRCSSNERRESV